MQANKGLIFTSDKCIGCSKCIKGCPVLGANITKQQDGAEQVVVNGEKCIHCGKCIKNCEHGARFFRDDFSELLNALSRHERIDLMIAPSFFFNYPDIAPQVVGYLRSLGFGHVYNVAEGAAITTWVYADYLKKNPKCGMISSACPVIVDYVEKYRPNLIEYLMPFQSPVGCLRTYLGFLANDSNVKYAFLCPCVGKGEEMISYSQGKKVADYNITFVSLMNYIRDNRLNITNFYGECDSSFKPGINEFYPVAGGLKQTLSLYFDESGNYIKQIEGQNNVYSYLNFLEEKVKNNSELPLFIDILNCEGGCTEGVANDAPIRDNDELPIKLARAKKEFIESAEEGFSGKELSSDDRFNMMDNDFRTIGLAPEMFSRDFDYHKTMPETTITPDVIETVFLKMNKNTYDERNINCGSCGYKNCHEMAIAIARGYNAPENCVHYARNLLERDQNALSSLLNELYGEGERNNTKIYGAEYAVQMVSKAIDNLEREKEQVFNESQARNQFFASMTHELRTPLNAIINMTDALRDQLSTSEGKDNLKSIKSAGEGLLDTINELLDLSKMSAGGFSIVEKKYSLPALLNDVAGLIKYRAAEKHLNFAVFPDSSLPKELIGDSKRIRQVLINLLGNAVKYTPSGSVSLTVTWNNNVDNPVICFDVTDTGMGIKEEDIPFLFDAYRQVDEAKNHHIEGTGLGLSIVKSLADEMKGTVNVKSSYGNGSTFLFVIPQKIEEFVPYDSDNGDSKENENELGVAFAIPKLKVLVVDDMSVNLRIAAGLMDNYQAFVVMASSGEETVEVCKEREFDLILLDFQMPGMNGLETMARIREECPLNEKANIVILSAEDEGVFRKNFDASDIDGYLSKPIDKGELECLLMDIVDKDKMIFIGSDEVPAPGTFKELSEKKDYDTYLEKVCAVERISKSISENQISHMAKSHRGAVQLENYSFVERNASYLDLEVESLRAKMNK